MRIIPWRAARAAVGRTATPSGPPLNANSRAALDDERGVLNTAVTWHAAKIICPHDCRRRRRYSRPAGVTETPITKSRN